MKKSELPTTDSVRELAAFWDAHDLTDFEDHLEDVAEPVFVREPDAAAGAINVPLEQGEAQAVEQIARAKGISREQLVRAWVLQQIGRPANARPRGQAR